MSKVVRVEVINYDRDYSEYGMGKMLRKLKKLTMKERLSYELKRRRDFDNKKFLKGRISKRNRLRRERIKEMYND